MNITCPHCKTKLNLPDDKIPKDRDTSFKCPKCRESVPVKAVGAGTFHRPKPVLSAGFTPVGGNQALICMPHTPARDVIAAAARGLGYGIQIPETAAVALNRLEFRIYPLVLLDGAFDPDGLMSAHMDEMDMSQRRKICLVKVSPDVPTGDPMAALHASANWVVNPGDLGNSGDAVAEFLVLALEAHQRFYSVFNESLKAAGKA